MAKLGQHFLIHKPTLFKIAKFLCPSPGDKIIEIGGGHGELTEYLAGQFPENTIEVIEKDERLAECLAKKFENNPRVTVRAGDALKVFGKTIERGVSYLLIANLPYYITGRLLRIVGEADPLPKNLVLMVQKEVAERITAVPPRMNRLSASVRAWGDPKIILRVPGSYFRPSPKVESAVMEITPLLSRNINPGPYYKTVKILFAQPRKTVLNNISRFAKKKRAGADMLRKAGIDTGARPQDLSVAKIAELSEIIFDG